MTKSGPYTYTAHGTSANYLQRVIPFSRKFFNGVNEPVPLQDGDVLVVCGGGTWFAHFRDAPDPAAPPAPSALDPIHWAPGTDGLLGSLKGQPETTLFMIIPERGKHRLRSAFTPDRDERTTATLFEYQENAKTAAIRYYNKWMTLNFPR